MAETSSPLKTPSPLPSSQRDERLDAFRGFALITIFINHVPGTLYENYTYRNIGFSDAAEAFVLISGIAAALAYSRLIRTAFQQALYKIIKRSALLYSVSIITSLLAAAIFYVATKGFGATSLLNMINMKPFFDDPEKGFIGLVTLGHQFGYFNILPMYAVLLLVLPFMLLVGLYSRKMLLALSFGLWAFSGYTGLNMPNYPTQGGWFFNPLAWQLLFVIGIVLGLRMKEGVKTPFSLPLFVTCILYLIAAAIWVRVPLWGLENETGLPAWIGGFDKTQVSLPRFLHIMALLYVLTHIPAVTKLCASSFAAPLRMIGRQALPVFATGSVLCVFLIALRTLIPTNAAIDASLLLSGIIIQFALAYMLEMRRKTAHAQNSLTVAPSLVA
jgi:hypothetical protein